MASETPFPSPNSSIPSEPPLVSSPPISLPAMFYSKPLSATWLTFDSRMRILPGHKLPYLLGLGFRNAVQLAPSAYLASAAASSGLFSHILPASLQSLPIPHLGAAVSLWSHGHDNPPPTGTAACSEKTWDTSVVSTTAESRLESAPDDITRTRRWSLQAWSVRMGSAQTW